MGWVVRCPACGSELEVVEDDVKSNRKNQVYVTCYNNEGQKRYVPYTFTINEKKVMNDPELAKVVEKMGGEMKEGVNPPC